MNFNGTDLMEKENRIPNQEGPTTRHYEGKKFKKSVQQQKEDNLRISKRASKIRSEFRRKIGEPTIDSQAVKRLAFSSIKMTSNASSILNINERSAKLESFSKILKNYKSLSKLNVLFDGRNSSFWMNTKIMKSLTLSFKQLDSLSTLKISFHSQS